MIILQLLSECAFLFSYPIGALIKFFFPIREKTSPRRDAKHKTTTILIFEQWFGQNFWHMYIKRYLEKRGFTIYWTNYSLLKGSHHDAALYLKEYIRKHNLNNIVLVGVSMGAVSSFLYLQEYNGWEKVKKFMSIGGPLKGTPFALFIVFLRSGRQIMPNSAFIKNLANSQIKHPDRITCISAKFDELVPRWSSSLPAAYNRVIDVVGHNNLHIMSRSVFASIVQEAAT